MIKFLKYFALLATLIPIGYLQAMEQQQLENPFQALNDDPQCRLRFVRYDNDDHKKIILKIILGRDKMLKSLIRPLSYERHQSHTLDLFMNEIENPRTGGDTNDTSRPYMILREDNSECIGFIWWRRDPCKRIAHWDYLALLQEWRRQGIGMLAACCILQWEKSKGTKSITSQVYSGNTAASSFLTQLGFEKHPVSVLNATRANDIYNIKNLQSKNLDFLLQKVQAKNSISSPIVTSKLNTNPVQSKIMATSSEPVQSKIMATSSDYPAQLRNYDSSMARMLNVSGKLLSVGGALMSLACITHCAPRWMQQRSRYAYGITALGALSYGAARWMQRK